MTRWIAVVLALGWAASARAQSRGFALERYEPTNAGEWSFMVEHPWYSNRLECAAAGVTLDYSHDPLVFGTRDSSGKFTDTTNVVAHQLALHIDAAVSFADRVAISFSLPVVLFESGRAADGVAPLSGAAVGDPRFGAIVRVIGRPLRDAFSLSLGLDLWMPATGGGPDHAGDSNFRIEPKAVIGGLTHHILWSFVAAFQYRPDARIGTSTDPAGATVGSELKFGGALAYADLERRFSVGPEAMFSTVVTGPVNFRTDSSSLELLLGGHYNIIKQIEVGVAGGVGLLREPGTPDGRFIVRLAYSPMRPDPDVPPPSDRDGDGILDERDACPDVKGVATNDPRTNGCPPAPPPDRDHDGVLDADDQCPDTPAGEHPDPDRRGCPLVDSDGDGIYDKDDACPLEAAGEHPSATRKGCPDTDKDGDGVYDSTDQCPDTPAGTHPDPARPGCPLPDRDGDGVPDPVDACPDKPGAPSPDPKKNGCPGLVEIKEGKVVILKPVYFANDKDTILPESFPVLQAVADALVATPELKRVAIEGHTDDRGKPEHNLDLSQRRAQSVMRFLVEHGVSADRLEAHGYGREKPIATNKTNAGRAANRRVEFKIVEGPGGEK